MAFRPRLVPLPWTPQTTAVVAPPQTGDAPVPADCSELDRSRSPIRGDPQASTFTDNLAADLSRMIDEVQAGETQERISEIEAQAARSERRAEEQVAATLRQQFA